MNSIKKLESLKGLSFRLKEHKVSKDFFERMEKEMIERRKETEKILELLTMSREKYEKPFDL